MRVMDLPGKKAKQVLERDRRYISPSYSRPYPAVIERGEGMWVWDVDDNRFLDFAAGIAVVQTGHCHPDIVEAITTQAGKLIHMSGTDFYYPIQTELAEKLAEIVPGGKNKRTFFCNSGAEAMETSIKLARYATNRPNILAFIGAFHGRTMGALSLTGSRSVQREGFFPLIPGVFHVPYGYCYRCSFNLTHPSCNFACIDYIEEELFRTICPPQDVCAFVAEPIQGEGGYIIPPQGYFQKLKALAEKYGALLILDEVQSGMGRTGKMFAIEHWGVKPDMVAIAKGVASGMPLGALVARSSLMNWGPGSHASTFGGNPLSCAAALKTIELLEKGLVENAARLGSYMLDRLSKLTKTHHLVGEVRGKGLMIAVEIVEDQESRKPAPNKRDWLVQECFRRGLLILGAGKTAARFSPPLIVSEREADQALTIFEESLEVVESRRSSSRHRS